MNSKEKLEVYLAFIKNFEEAIKKENNIPKNENIWNYMTDNFNIKGTVASFKYIKHGL